MFAYPIPEIIEITHENSRVGYEYRVIIWEVRIMCWDWQAKVCLSCPSTYPMPAGHAGVMWGEKHGMKIFNRCYRRL